MSSFSSANPSPLLSPVNWTRLARARIEAMPSSDGALPRGLIVGPAGSGKSVLLRHLQRILQKDGRSVTLAHPRSDIAGAPATTVLLVDDAQRLDPEQLAALAQRVDSAEAPTVVACRPWPSQPVLHDITRSLERSQSAIVLGHITAGELHAGAHAAGRPLAPSCVSSIIELTGGITWLVLHALAVHDEIDCEADREHRGISDALQDAIAHRLLSVDADLRHAVEIVSVAPPGAVAPILSDRTDLVLAGYAEGVLAHNGQAVPVVRSAVRATMPVERLVRAGFETGHLDLTDDLLFSHLAAGDGSRVAAALLKQGDAAIASDPQRAATLYARAEEAGADPTTVGIRKAETAWAIGDIDRAGSLLDALDVDESSPVREKAVDLAAAVWAARGSMEMSRAVYISASQPDRPAEVHALIANVAAGYRERDEPAPSPPPAGTIPSTLQVSTQLLSRGLRETLSGTPASSIDDLVRATETYTASRCIAPIPELPAVIAALTAINLGELDIAESLLRDAIAGGHGGRWARNRLLLWSGWVAVRQGLPDAARGFLHSARSSTQTLSPRDHHLADAIDVALARRNGDVQALRAALDRARKSVLHTEFDLFSLLPLAELVIAAAQLGSGLLVHRRFEDALARMRGMGSPPLWSAQLYWAGVLQGVHEDRPAELKRHLEALLTAAPHSRLAAHTAQAGQNWVALRAGDVDVDAVERSARGLASVGLRWDGADLAGYAAARIDDRKAISRLLGCARELQQREHFLETPDPGQRAEPQDPARSAPLLSAREREVAVLVLAGKTYVEIGAAMFISPRTAEHHIARIRRRVGAASRSDLIAKLRLMFEGEDDEGKEGEPDSSAPPRRESA